MATSESDTKTLEMAKKFKSMQRASKLLLQGILSKSKILKAAISTPGPQPPFPHLFQSNIPPTESETPLLRDAITAAEVEESRLKEMASSHSGSSHLSTSKTVKNLNREIERTHQFIAQHKAILSIRKIPSDILQTIFIYTLPIAAKDSIPSTVVRSASQLPWALSQVCQHWRTIMLSFSFMWRDLPILKLREAYTEEKPYLDFLAEMLKRSNNMPIRLCIMDGGDSYLTHPAVDMLVLHSDRWQEVKIHARLEFMPAFQKIKGRLSSLQSLFLSLYSAGTTDPLNYTSYDLFWIAPQLRHVEVAGPTNKFMFPTHQFIHYCQNAGSLDRVVPVLVSSSSLRILQLHGFQHGEANVLLMTTPLRLPDLTVLDASFYEASAFHEPFFNSIAIPAIEELSVMGQSLNVTTPICSVILRSDSSCLLKILRLHTQFAPGELTSLLMLTPLLTNLSIALPPTQDIFALTFDGHTPALVPLLDECDFILEHNDAPSTETIQALRSFASSRCELPDNATSVETLLLGEFHPLQALRIVSGWKTSLYRQDFEGWVYGDVAAELRRHGERLFAVFPELVHHNIPFKRTFDLKWKNKVTNLLTHIETLNIEKASDICISGIRPFLHAISIMPKTNHMGSTFTPIAERILKKWEPILRGDMQNVRWLSTGHSLKYLSTAQNRVRRSSPNAIDLFYGMDIDRRFELLLATITEHISGTL